MPSDLADVLGRHATELVLEHLLGAWSGGVAMRVVLLDEDVVDADAAAELPDVVAAVGGAADIVVDGGVRPGADIVLALGAQRVLLGRPTRARSYERSRQVSAWLAEFLAWRAADLERCMRMCGAFRLADVTPDTLARS